MNVPLFQMRAWTRVIGLRSVEGVFKGPAGLEPRNELFICNISSHSNATYQLLKIFPIREAQYQLCWGDSKLLVRIKRTSNPQHNLRADVVPQLTPTDMADTRLDTLVKAPWQGKVSFLSPPGYNQNVPYRDHPTDKVSN